jgi:FAD/FMN-containing dehydrogenase
MPAIDVDSAARRARVEAGVLQQEIADAAAEHGLAAPLGRASPPRRGTGRAVPRSVVARWESDRTYFNVTERSVDGDDLFPPDTYRRLREVKALYDPEELFQAMHSISPAR